jgi:hypothetical protein
MCIQAQLNINLSFWHIFTLAVFEAPSFEKGERDEPMLLPE